MSDDEGHTSGSRSGGGGGGPPGGLIDDDLTLPKATVQKLINEIMPDHMSCPKDSRDFVTACCVEFIHLISSEANDACEKDQKKTISPEHVVSALKSLGFDDYIEEVEGVLDEHKEHQKVRQTKQSASSKKNIGVSQEELLAQQELLFAASRARYEAGGST
ncbi:histone-fold-containing protein [Phaffia rhodozyma]|uniref:Histone-fold-containing protein n=1 Tax=Phaffia rhodozyma TaxID=264483 RepID=A0A0F7SE69_PHARH|nr:histone-fold-containing protein [Phaffia rhodozyma]